MANYNGLGFGVILAIFLVFCINNASSTNCYLCESPLGGYCGNNINNLTFTNLTTVSCVGDTSYCVADVELEAGFGSSKIRRGCGKSDHCKEINATLISQCIICNTDLCNSAISTIPSVVAVGFLTLFLTKLVI